MIRHKLLVSLLLLAMTGSASAAPITYYFAGALNDPFGTLIVGTPFKGSFSYDDSQPLNTPLSSNRGDYKYTNLSVTFGDTTVSDNGTGVINVYNNPGYPTDLFHLYAFSVSGTLGGLTLTPRFGLQVVLQDITGTVFNSLELPSRNLTLGDFTLGNATFLELRATSQGAFRYTTARGELSYLSAVTSVPEPASFTVVLSGLGIFSTLKFSIKRRSRT